MLQAPCPRNGHLARRQEGATHGIALRRLSKADDAPAFAVGCPFHSTHKNQSKSMKTLFSLLAFSILASGAVAASACKKCCADQGKSCAQCCKDAGKVCGKDCCKAK